MPNKKGGKKYKKGKREQDLSNKELEFKEAGQDYAQVEKILGNCRLRVRCFDDNKTRLGVIRGAMRKRIWMSVHDVVLVGLRNFQDDKVDIIHKYSDDDVRKLRLYGELPETVRIGQLQQSKSTKEKEDEEFLVFEDI